MGSLPKLRGSCDEIVASISHNYTRFFLNEEGKVEKIVFDSKTNSLSYVDSNLIEHRIHKDPISGSLYVDDICVLSVDSVFSGADPYPRAEAATSGNAFGDGWSLYKTSYVTIHGWSVLLNRIIVFAFILGIGIVADGFKVSSSTLISGGTGIIAIINDYLSSPEPDTYCIVEEYINSINCYRNRTYHYRYSNYTGYTGYTNSEFYDIPIY